jgi:ABC-type polysaccharide transport system, permease component
MMLPGLLYLLVNNYLPMLGIFIAFKDVNFSMGIFKSPWVGFKNFEFLFRTSDALVITRNTLLFNVAFIAVNLVVSVTVALLLNEVKSRALAQAYQSVILIPMLISMVIVSYLVLAFLSSENGFVNRSIMPLFGREGVMWYAEAKRWPFILVFVNAWKGVGLLSVVYYAAIIGIDGELYEAAIIDGASKGRQIRSITLPLIVPVITTMTLLAIGRIFYSDFGLFYQVPMDSGALYDVTNVIDTYVYRGLMQLGDIGMSSAAGLYQSVVGFVLVLFSNWVVRKMNPDNALF